MNEQKPRLADLLGVFAVIALLALGVAIVRIPIGAILRFPGRKAALMMTCGSNERQMAYGAIAYANDWKQQLPTRSTGGEPMLFAMSRLAIIGFDTATTAGIDVIPRFLPSGKTPRGPPPGIPGLAYLLRDYLKNDWDIIYCPDGWIQEQDGIQRNHFRPVPLGYQWLPHRVDRSGQCHDKTCTTDKPGDIVRRATDAPKLLLIADFSWRRLDEGDMFAANHMPIAGFMPPALTPPGRPSAKPSDWLKFGQAPMECLPLGGNVARLDCRVTWTPWQSVDTSRYVVDGSVLMW